MGRADFSKLLGNTGTLGDDFIAEATAGLAPVLRVETPPAPTLTDGVKPAAGYLAFVRKETRLRPEQVEALTVLARSIARANAGRGVRITENTLIRIAVDMLLDRSGELDGAIEGEIRRVGAIR